MQQPAPTPPPPVLDSYPYLRLYFLQFIQDPDSRFNEMHPGMDRESTPEELDAHFLSYTVGPRSERFLRKYDLEFARLGHEALFGLECTARAKRFTLEWIGDHVGPGNPRFRAADVNESALSQLLLYVYYSGVVHQLDLQRDEAAEALAEFRATLRQYPRLPYDLTRLARARRIAASMALSPTNQEDPYDPVHLLTTLVDLSR